jgi:hypothetical protein
VIGDILFLRRYSENIHSDNENFHPNSEKSGLDSGMKGPMRLSKCFGLGAESGSIIGPASSIYVLI